MTLAYDVIVCGSLHLDIVVNAPHLPKPDETVPGTVWNKICGGKGGNQAVIAARAGASCAMIGRVGDDDFGRILRSNLASQAVNIDHVSVDTAQGTGMSVAIVESAGDYGAVIVSGSNLSLLPKDAAGAWAKLGGAKTLILQNEIPEHVNIAVAQAAKQAGAHVILNAAPARQMSDDLLNLVDVFVVNRVEAEMLGGITITDIESVKALIPKLARVGQEVVITLGGLGLVYYTKDKSTCFVEPHQITVKSTHGAGDCFVGVLAFELANGSNIESACGKANACAAQFVAGLRFVY